MAPARTAHPELSIAALTVILGAARPVGAIALHQQLLRRGFDVSEATGQPVKERIAAHLANKRLLLVLDNFEHLLSAAPLIADLLAICPALTVLATSRAPLRLTAGCGGRPCISPLITRWGWIAPVRPCAATAAGRDRR